MKEYSDYIQTTRTYLKRYNQFKATIENLQDDIDGLKQAIEHDVAAPISRYGDEPGGGTPELNVVEAAAARHAAMNKRIAEAQASIDSISRIIRKVDRALGALPDEDKRLIVGHYIDRKSWRQLGREEYLTEEWACEKARRAVKEMSFTIFAKQDEQQELRFVFFE